MRSCQKIKKIVVTTPDKKILNYIKRKYNNERVLGLERPLKLARINTPSEDTIHHVLENFNPNEKFNYFFGSSIETPFKRKELIQSGINIAKIFNVDTVIGVRQSREKHFRHNGEGLISINPGKDFLRLEGSQIYTKVSGYLIREINSFKKTNSIFGHKIGHVIIDRKSMFEIKDKFDIQVAEVINEQSTH